MEPPKYGEYARVRSQRYVDGPEKTDSRPYVHDFHAPDAPACEATSENRQVPDLLNLLNLLKSLFSPTGTERDSCEKRNEKAWQWHRAR